MNYKRIYDQIVARGKERVLEGYKESHHIVPRCLGGTDELDNIVNLTPEEHYVCHQLLVKIHPGHAGLIYAANMMGSCDRDGDRAANKLYGWLRRKMSTAIGDRMRKANIGKPKSEEHKRKISEALKSNPTIRWKGQKRYSDEELEKRRQIRIARNKDPEFRRKCSEGRKGMKMSEETKRKMSEIAKARHASRRA